MPNVQHKRGTRAALDALATASGLKPGQLYLISDEDRIAAATAANTYQAYAKEGEGGDLVSDTTPQLGGNLDANGNTITTSSGDLKLDSATGKAVFNGAAALHAFNVKSSGLNARLNFQGGAGDNPGVQLQNDATGTRRVLIRLNESGTLGTELQIYTVPAAGGGAVNTATFEADGDLTITGNLYSADHAYSAGWNGDMGAPTKNAVYDKIESLILGGGGISNLVEDTTPQLGGDLDPNGKKVTGPINIDDNTTVLFTATNTAVGGSGIIGYDGAGAYPANGTRLGFYLFGSKRTGTSINSSGITGYTTEAWGAAAAGNEIRVETIANGTTSRTAKFWFRNNGDFDVLGDIDATAVTVDDEAYGAGWNGSTEVPTKNALYDKIESLGGGSSGDYCEYYTAASGITAINNVAQTLKLSSSRVSSSGSVFVMVSHELTINKTGDFKFTFDSYINSSASARSEYSIWLERDTGSGFSEETGTRSAIYARGYDSGQSASINCILSVTSGDKFRYRVRRTDGGGISGYQDDNGTRLIVEEK